MNYRYYYPGINSNEMCAVAPDHNTALKIYARLNNWSVAEVRDDLLDIGESLFKGGEDNRPIGFYGR